MVPVALKTGNGQAEGRGTEGWSGPDWSWHRGGVARMVVAQGRGGVNSDGVWHPGGGVGQARLAWGVGLVRLRRGQSRPPEESGPGQGGWEAWAAE